MRVPQFATIELVLAAHMGTRGLFPPWMLHAHPELAERVLAPNGDMYDVDPPTMPAGVYRITPRAQTTLRDVLATIDAPIFGDVESFTEFAESLLTLDPNNRPTAADAAAHPWVLAQAA